MQGVAIFAVCRIAKHILIKFQHVIVKITLKNLDFLAARQGGSAENVGRPILVEIAHDYEIGQHRETGRRIPAQGHNLFRSAYLRSGK